MVNEDEKPRINEEVKTKVKTTKKENEDDEKVDGVELSSHIGEDCEFISEIAKADAKTEDNLDQMFTCFLDSGSKVDKVWE